MINDSDNDKKDEYGNEDDRGSQRTPPAPAKAEASDAKRREGKDDNDDEHDWRNDDCKDDGETMTRNIDMTMVM